jgi:dolichyl-phosphate-mannose-protein mannosyltransferase
VNPEATGRRRGVAPGVLLAGLVVLALALRFWRLGEWNLEGDEIFTLRDSTSPPRLGNPRPLLYFLNYYVVRPLVPLDELGLRLLPALFGVLAIPVFYLVARRVLGTRAALFGSLFLTVSSLHVYHSQAARYWSLVFLLSAVYPFAIYLGIRERNPRAMALGLVTGILAVLAHPTSVLLVGGLGVWLLVTALQRERLAQLWNRRNVRWGVYLGVILIAIITTRFIPMLRGWMSAHTGTQPSDHLLGLPSGRGVTQVGILLSYVEGLTTPLVLVGVVGIWLLWQSRERSLALLLISLLIFPVAFIVLLSLRTAVSTTYLMPTAPVFFMGAGVLMDRLAAVDWKLRPRWLVPATIAIVIILGSVPTLISQYRDGRRNDFRGVARWLHPRIAPGDVVFSDQFLVLSHYMGEAVVQRLIADTTPLAETARQLHAAHSGGTLWIVVPHSARGSHRTNPKMGTLKSWLYQNCQLRNSVGVARLDYRQNELEIYRCPPGSDTAEASTSPLRAKTLR